MLCFHFATVLWFLLHAEALVDPEAFITVPSTLYVEHDNLISIKTVQPTSRAQLITTIPSLNNTIVDIQDLNLSTALQDGLYGEDILYKAPFVPIAEQSINVRLTFAFTFCANPKCTSSTVKYFTNEPSIARRSVVVLGQTDRSIYRPGETVRFSFLTLTPQFTVPLDGPVHYPQRGLVRNVNTGELAIETVTPATFEWLHRILYNEIFVQDNKGNKISRWLNVTPVEAASLSYPLLTDAQEGRWCITAQVWDQIETLSFTVKHFVLPRFVLEIKPPKNLSLESTFTEYSICAKYTNGPPMIGSVRSYLCVCDGSSLSDTASSPEKDIMKTGFCPTRFASRLPRPCVQRDDIVEKDGCVKFNTPTTKLYLGSTDYSSWGQSVVVCVEAREEGTGATVTRCKVGGQLATKRTTMEITAPSVHKPGLPISIDLQIKGPLLTDELITVECSESWNSHFYLLWSESQLGRYQYVTKVKPNSSGFVRIIVPPPTTRKSISIKATYAQQNTTHKKVQSKHRAFLACWTDDSATHGVVAYAYLSPWESKLNVSLQVWPNEQTFDVKPSGVVSVDLMANVPLSNKTFIVQALVRGKVFKHIVAPMNQVDEQCEDRDDWLGHYRCLDSDTNEIECLDGWQGVSCLEPTCAPGCHPRGGICALPNDCLCMEWWTGPSCKTCFKREGCKHGHCVDGNDCVCEQGWQGYLCDHVKVSVERIIEDPDYQLYENFEKSASPSISTKEALNLSTTSSRRLYQRQISFPIDGNWGPEATVVIFFYDKRRSTIEIIPAIVKLTNLANFTSPSIAMESQRNTSGIRFDQASVNSGQHVQLTLTPTGVDASALKHSSSPNETPSDQVCFLRISDIALDNVHEPKQLLYLENYVQVIRRLHTTNSWRHTVGKNVQEAFDATGFKYVSESANESEQTGLVGLSGVAMSDWRDAETIKQRSVHGAVENVLPIVQPNPRELVPEVWLIEAVPIGLFNSSTGQSTVGIQKSLIAPDAITSWRASAFCTTKSNGLWIPNPTELTVTKPFYIQITLPNQAKHGEILFIPVSVFVIPDGSTESNRKQCYEVRVATVLDEEDWLRVSEHNFFACVCTGEKRTFHVGLMPLRWGQLNVTAEAHANADSELCGGIEGLRVQERYVKLGAALSDKIQRHIHVLPEGVAKQAIVEDILCLPSGVSHMNLTTPVILPPNTLPGSLRVYLTYTDEILGPALHNIDSLVRLPKGNGERNMKLVASNVYVLEYLKYGPLVKDKTTEHLIETARMHIMTGYKGQLKYRLKDGSYSAFGQSDDVGSTWLTAFVLNVFSKAHRVDDSLDIDWNQLFNETFTFLKQRQELGGSGCFVEKGYMMSSLTQGGDSDKNNDALLTAYVLSTFNDLRETELVSDYEAFNSIIDSGIRCIKAGIPKDILSTESCSNAFNYQLAHASHVLQMYQPGTNETELYIEELLGRQQTISDPIRGTSSYWLARNSSDKAERDCWSDASDVETTSYAYLTLTRTGRPLLELIPIVRWLSVQQKMSGGCRSTQDTLLVMQVITDAAIRLKLNGTNSTNTNLELTATIIPSGQKIDAVITDAKRQVINQLAIPYTDSKDIEHVNWELNSEITSAATRCMALQIALFYNVPHPDSQLDAPYTITATVTQQKPWPTNACKTAMVTACLRLSPTVSVVPETETLLVRVELINGWQPVQEDKMNLVGTDEESVRQVEVDSNGTLSFSFDGFTTSESKKLGGMDRLKRCAQLNMYQTTFVESSRPGVISATDINAGERPVTTSYQLENCKSAWLTDDPQLVSTTSTSTTTEPSTSTETPAPGVCPNCQLDALNTNLTDNVYNMICNGYANIFLLTVYASDEELIHVTMAAISNGVYASTWNATINRTDHSNCSCVTLLTVGSNFLWLVSDRLDVSLGQPVISLISSVHGAILLPVEDVLPNLRQAQSRFESDQVVGLDFDSLYLCKRIKPTVRYIEKKLLIT